MKKVFIFVYIIILVPTISNGQWISKSLGPNLYLNSIFFVDNNTGWAVGRLILYGGEYYWAKSFKSTNSGLTWDSVSVGKQDAQYYNVYFINNNTGFIVGSEKLYRTINGGNSWNIQNLGYWRIINSIFFLNNNGWATYDTINGVGFLRTTDGGDNWVFESHLGADTKIDCLYFVNNNTGWAIYAYQYNGTNYGDHFVKTTDGGYNWQWVFDLYHGYLHSIYMNDENTGWAVGQPGSIETGYICKTTNGGNNWNVQTYSQPLQEVTFINMNTGWIVGNYKVLKTTNAGNSWYNQYTTDTLGWRYSWNSIYMLNENTGWVVGEKYNGAYEDTGLILRTTNGGNPIGVEKISTKIPQQFSISQNYPNPFNPITDIKFDIVSKGNIKLSVLDILGHEVTILINQELQAGSYKVVWDGRKYASGIYFYKLETKDFQQTKKMILIK